MKYIAVSKIPIVLSGIEAYISEYELDARCVGRLSGLSESEIKSISEPPEIAILNLAPEEVISKIHMLRRPFNGLKVIVIHDSITRAEVFEMKKFKIQGIISLSCGPDDFEIAFFAVRKGHHFLGNSINSTTFDSGEEKGGNGTFGLSEREIQMLKHLVNGQELKDIAIDLDIAITTAFTHRRNIMRKLGLRNSRELVKFAFENGYA